MGRTGLVALLVAVCSLAGAAPAGAFTHRPFDPHLPMRDRGGRVGRPQACRGILLSSSGGIGPALWYLRAPGASAKLLIRLDRGAGPVGAAVAPDGRTIALEIGARTEKVLSGMHVFSRIPLAPSAPASIVIARVPATGGRPDVLARFAGSSPSWSRDGRRLAFQRGEAVLISSSVAWGRPEFVASGRDPAWSPAGNRLAIVRGGRTSSAILLLDPDGATPLTDGSRIDGSPAWSPDAGHVVFARRKRPGGWDDLWIVRARGGRPRRLTHFNHYNGARYFEWSPDGRHVAFTMVNSEAWGLRVVDVATGRVRAPAHPVETGGLGPFTSFGAWRAGSTLLYEAGQSRRSLWSYSLEHGRAAQVFPRRPSFDVLDRGLCGRTPRR